MNLIIMKFLIAAIFGTLFVGTVSSRSEEGDFDLEKIQTEQGRIYQDILILGADRHGLTFRHREGIAKIEFPSLSANIRMLYEVTDEAPGAGSEEIDGNPPVVAPGEPAVADEEGRVLVLHHRLTLYAPVNGWPSCLPCQDGITWRSSWPRYHPAHRLAFSCYRERTVRDFLFLSGISGRG